MDQDHEAAERRLERLRRRHLHSMELLRATVAFEHAAIKPPMLLNGGALVVFLALIGTLKARPGIDAGFSEGWALGALLVWVVGLVFATTAIAKGYYSQLAFRKAHDTELTADEQKEGDKRVTAIQRKRRARGFLRKGHAHRRCAELSILASIGLFVVGVGFGLLAVSETLRVWLGIQSLCFPHLCPT